MMVPPMLPMPPDRLADDGGGNRVHLRALARGGHAALELGRDQQAAEHRAEAGARMALHNGAVHVDAGHFGHVLIAADRVNAATERRMVEQEIGQQQHDA